MGVIMENAPKTFVELMEGERWRTIRRLFRRHNMNLSVSTSEEAMGRYSEVVLDGDGFKIKTGKSGMVAASTGRNDHSFRPVRSAKEVLERALAFDESLSEAMMISEIIKKIEKLESIPLKRAVKKMLKG